MMELFEEATAAIEERTDIHGEAEDSFETIAELWNGYLRGGGITDPNITAEDVANMMILLKVARNAEGHYREDNYVDIAGYAANGNRLRE